MDLGIYVLSVSNNLKTLQLTDLSQAMPSVKTVVIIVPPTNGAELQLIAADE